MGNKPLSIDESCHILRNTLSVHLPNSVLHSHQIAARRLCGVAGGVLGEVCLMYSKQESTLLSQTLDCY